MQDFVDIIQTIARQRGRGDGGPLLLLRSFSGGAGKPITHLPIENDLGQAWQALFGEPFRPHHAQALAAARKGDPVALLSDNPRVSASAYLLLYALATQLGGSALVIAPDARSAQAARNRIQYVNEQMPVLYRLVPYLLEEKTRPNPNAHVFITTPEGLHNRMLRHHDRAWSAIWPHIQVALVQEIHTYSGIAGAHLADLLMRIQRVAANYGGHRIPHLLATGWGMAAPLPALESIYPAPWRVLDADDLPYEPTTLVAWRGATDRLRESADVARALQKQGYQVHILCQPLEQHLIAAIIGETDDITYGPQPRSAHIVLCAGYPGSQSHLRRLLRSGYQAVIVVLGDAPHEQMLSRHSETLATLAPSGWPASPINIYVTAQHLLCAASELPLTEGEVDASGLRDVVNRMVASDQLVDLPDPEVAWKPGVQVGDPYAGWSLFSASGGTAQVRTEQGKTIGSFDAGALERWGHPNAALPPLRGGLRVTALDGEAMQLSVRIESNGRRTLPLRRCLITVREEIEQRQLFLANQIGLGRVLAEEEIQGWRETAPQSMSAEPNLRPVEHTRWSASCCWFELPVTPPATAQLIGWSLAAAVELHSLGSMQDLVPCYVAEKRRLYFVDSQPGGHGLAAWLYAHAEDLLPTAYDIALACRNDALFEPVARADMDWLLPLLGKRDFVPRPAEQAAPQQAEPAQPPKLVLLPAPEPAQASRQEVPTRANDAVRRAPSPSEPPASPARRTPPPIEPPRQRAEPPPQRAEPQPPRQRAEPPPQRAEPPAPPASEPRQRSFDDDAPRRTPAPSEPPRQRAEPPTPPASEPRRTANEPRQRAEPPAPQQPVQRGGRNANRQQQRPPPPARAEPPAPPPEPVPDANALIERLRRQREQRERYEQPRPSAPPPASNRSAPVVLRFKAGDHVFCLPYGDGIVRESRSENDRELLEIEFPEYGELTIDPSVSLVRKTEEAPEDDDLL